MRALVIDPAMQIGSPLKLAVFALATSALVLTSGCAGGKNKNKDTAYVARDVDSLYAAAKERQRLVEARISMLQKRVSEIALLNVDRIPKDRAGFGSTVHVIEDTGDKLTFQLVMPEDADATKGLISTTSPIGRAFLNKEEGDTVKVATPGGTRGFEIVKLLTIHDEAAG